LTVIVKRLAKIYPQAYPARLTVLVRETGSLHPVVIEAAALATKLSELSM
jgi:hypothetical protein